MGIVPCCSGKRDIIKKCEVPWSWRRSQLWQRFHSLRLPRRGVGLMQIRQNRRHLLASLSAVGAASVLGARRSLADEGPPETTTIRLAYYPNICLAPLLVAEDLLRAEGFTEIRYVSLPKSFTTPELVARGEIHFANTFAGTLVAHMDRGLPVTALAGVHSGCYELFAHEPIRTISELQGQEHRHPGPELRRALLPGDHGRARRARPPEGLQLGHQSRRQSHGAFRRRQGRRLSRASRPSLRSCERATSVG